MQRARDVIQGALDRRYLRRDSDIEPRLAAVEDRLTQVDQELQGMLTRIRQVERLADECARAIERLLQEDLLLRRDLDQVTGQSIDPDRSSPSRR
jgi:hypothetical protein